MPVEEIIKQLVEVRNIITDAQKRQIELEDALIHANDKEWDSISVSKAVTKSGLSASTIYRFIQAGKIKCIHKGSLMFVSSKELEEFDEGC